MAVTWARQPEPVPDDLFADVIRAALRAFAEDVDPILNIGISGSRQFTPEPQRARFTGTLGKITRTYPGIVVIHHGCCTGIDELAHAVGRKTDGCQIFGYPGTDARGKSPYRMRDREGFAKIFPPAVYSERNRAIVAASTFLIGAPLYPEDDPRSLRSGTWQTIRYARKTRKPVITINSDGELFL
jgi:hypothetical protein